MEYQTRSVAGGTKRHATFKEAWDLYQQSLMGEDEDSLMFDDMKYEMFPGAPENFCPGLIWKISFVDETNSSCSDSTAGRIRNYQPHRWVRNTYSDLLKTELKEDQEFYLEDHKKDIIQRGIPALMEEITQDKIQIMGGLNKTFKRKLEAQENDDQIFWVDQPLDSNKYSWDKGFLKILDVLTEEEFKAKYYVPESGR